MRFILGGFLVLHGLVHLLYLGQSQRVFALASGLRWPDGSWALSGLLGERATRSVASIACAVAALGFIAAGGALLLRQGWWHSAIVSASAFSTLLLVLLWNGRMQKLAEQGAVAVLINAALLVAVLGAHWPDLDF